MEGVGRLSITVGLESDVVSDLAVVSHPDSCSFLSYLSPRTRYKNAGVAHSPEGSVGVVREVWVLVRD